MPWANLRAFRSRLDRPGGEEGRNVTRQEIARFGWVRIFKKTSDHKPSFNLPSDLRAERMAELERHARFQEFSAFIACEILIIGIGQRVPDLEDILLPQLMIENIAYRIRKAG